MSSFYKLLVTPDFDSQLRLPPQFVKDHAKILPSKATLRIESGESWIVKIERIGHHRFFTEGWEKFSRDVDLEFNQFMLFRFDGESGFRVSVYGMSGCERELSVCNTGGGSENSEQHGDFAAKVESGDEDDAKIDEERGFRAGKQWQFRAKLKKHNETELEVPVDFAKATGIAENGRIFLLTHSPKSKKWPVFVTTRRQDKDHETFAMTVGWNDFLVGSKRLPTEFTRRYGHNLPDCISLKVPTGLVWKVGLIHSNLETWLHQGWQRFLDYYLICFGHLLLFEYVENSLFEVHIFDTSATEIEYFEYDSLNRVAGLNHVDITERDESESDDSVVFLEEILREKNVGSKDQDVADGTKSTDNYIEVIGNNPPSRWRKKRRMHESSEQKLGKSSRGEQNTSSPIKESRFVASSPNYRCDIDEGIEGTKLKYSDRKQVQQQARDAKTRFKAYVRASLFMSEKPNQNPFFIVAMPPSDVNTRRSSLHIPSAFARNVMIPDRKNSLILVCKGKTWQVNYISGKEKTTLTSGWRKFMRTMILK